MRTRQDRETRRNMIVRLKIAVKVKNKINNKTIETNKLKDNKNR